MLSVSMWTSVDFMMCLALESSSWSRSHLPLVETVAWDCPFGVREFRAVPLLYSARCRRQDHVRRWTNRGGRRCGGGAEERDLRIQE